MVRHMAPASWRQTGMQPVLRSAEPGERYHRHLEWFFPPQSASWRCSFTGSTGCCFLVTPDPVNLMALTPTGDTFTSRALGIHSNWLCSKHWWRGSLLLLWHRPTGGCSTLGEAQATGVSCQTSSPLVQRLVGPSCSVFPAITWGHAPLLSHILCSHSHQGSLSQTHGQTS